MRSEPRGEGFSVVAVLDEVCVRCQCWWSGFGQIRLTSSVTRTGVKVYFTGSLSPFFRRSSKSLFLLSLLALLGSTGLGTSPLLSWLPLVFRLEPFELVGLAAAEAAAAAESWAACDGGDCCADLARASATDCVGTCGLATFGCR